MSSRPLSDISRMINDMTRAVIVGSLRTGMLQWEGCHTSFKHRYSFRADERRNRFDRLQKSEVIKGTVS